MPQLGTHAQPLRVAIIGSGPSGFFAAEALFKAEAEVNIDVFDRLPTPFGLVRGGVAPDHPKIKSVTKVFTRTAGNTDFAFIGNVSVGKDLTIEQLRSHYDAVIFAIGAETDRRLDIPGIDLPGSHTATEFVGWYNGHPDYRGRSFDLSQEVAVVIGQGNVAIDVCRILAKSAEELHVTDIASHAVRALSQSRIREIHIVGRRGPAQAKFTPAEVRELGDLDTAQPIVAPADLELDARSLGEIESGEAANPPKNLDILKGFAGQPRRSVPRHIHFHFLKSPAALEGDGRVQRIILERNRLEGEPFGLRAVGTGETEALECGLVFRSVGYRGVRVPGVPFDEDRGLMPNEGGRIVENGKPVPGLYAAGWIKRGPSGIIGTNKPDSAETVRALIEDLPTLAPCPKRDTGDLLQTIEARGIHPVTFGDWEHLDAAEIARGKPTGKPREKFTSVEEMIAAVRERS